MKALWLIPMALLLMAPSCSTPADGDLSKSVAMSAPIHGSSVEVHRSPGGQLIILNGEVDEDFGATHNKAYKGWKVYFFDDGGITKVAYEELPPQVNSIIILQSAEMTFVGEYTLAIE